MKYLKYFEQDTTFGPYDDEPLSSSEKMFGKKTRLEKQFSDIMVANLISADLATAVKWSIINASKIEIENLIGKDDVLYKEFQYRIVNGEPPANVLLNIITKLPKITEEINRLLIKIKIYAHEEI